MGLILVKSKEDVCKERAEFECNVMFGTKLEKLRGIGRERFKEFIALNSYKQEMVKKIYAYHMDNYKSASDMYVKPEHVKAYGRFQTNIPRSPFFLKE